MERSSTISQTLTGEMSIEPVLKITSEPAREEYIEVEPNVCLHVTDAGEGKGDSVVTRLAAQ